MVPFQPVVVGEDAVFGVDAAQRRPLPPHQPGRAALSPRARHPRASAARTLARAPARVGGRAGRRGRLRLKPPRRAAARRVLAAARPRPRRAASCGRSRCPCSAAWPASRGSGTATRPSSASPPTPTPRPSSAWRFPPRRAELWQRVEADVDASAFVTRLVHFPSRDGTPVSMFLVHQPRPAERRDGPAPAHGLRRVLREPHARVRALAAPLPRAGRALRGGPPARGRRIRRGLAPRGHARQEAERVRRLPRRRGVPDRERPRREGPPGHHGRQQRRPAGGRRPHPAAGALPRGGLPGAAARHAALPPLPHRAAVDPRVRRSRRRPKPSAGSTPTRPITTWRTARPTRPCS